MYTFDTPDSPHGLDVCLDCYIGTSPDPAHDFTSLHSLLTGHKLFVNLRRHQMPMKPLPTDKLAIAPEPKYETTAIVRDLGGSPVDQDDYRAQVQKILDADSYSKSREIESWELQITPCEHVLTHSADLAHPLSREKLSKCAACDLDSNLWLCLTCGSLGCGRQQFGGGGGNGHALTHFDETKHPLAVKLGSISPEGQADVYCYSCDEEVKDPEIPTHLASWGIDVATRTKTEKSTTELQVEQNINWDFKTDLGEAVSGPGFTGMKNLGNTCYFNSVMQCLIDLPIFQEAFPANTPATASHVIDPPFDLWTQMRKLQDGLMSGRYDVITPSMLRYVIGRGHPEFATTRQQDAFEFLTYILTQISHAAKVGEQNDPASALGFVTERKIRCTACNGVRLVDEPQENISVSVPIRKNTDGYESVDVSELFDSFAGPEELEVNCPRCAHKYASSSVGFKTYPDVLVLNVRRFEIVDWVPRKVDVPVKVPSELPLERYRSEGLLSGEEVVEEPKFQLDPEALQTLEGMGFPHEQVARALEVRNNNIESAMEYILGGGGVDAAPDGPSAEAMSALESMGFSSGQASAALRANGGTVESAVEWLFAGHTEDEVPPEDPESEKNEVKERGSAELPTDYELRSIVCHKGTSVHAGHYVAAIRRDGKWYLFNDERVVEGTDAEELQKYAYIYIFVRKQGK